MGREAGRECKSRKSKNLKAEALASGTKELRELTLQRDFIVKERERKTGCRPANNIGKRIRLKKEKRLLANNSDKRKKS